MTRAARVIREQQGLSLIDIEEAIAIDRARLSRFERGEMMRYDKLKALGFEVERPGGTFYIFPKALEEDANAFCLRARAYDLLLVPSDSFGVKGYVRLAYCIDTEKVERSLPALEKLAASYRK